MSRNHLQNTLELLCSVSYIVKKKLRYSKHNSDLLRGPDEFLSTEAEWSYS